MNTKPIVNIKDAFLIGDETNRRLMGTVLDYPESHQWYPGAVENNQTVTTSRVLSVEDDRVETLRTIYNVLNWAAKP